MKKVLLALLLSTSLARAQVPQTGAGLNPPVTSAYQGPGDVITFAHWYGFRAYSAAKAGTKAIRIVRASDSTQSDINSLANGSLDASTATSFCNATSCKVVTLYDQVGSTDATQGTDANRPTLTTSALNSSYCMTTTGSTPTFVVSSGTVTQGSQPYSGVLIAKQTNTSGDQGVFALMNSGFTDGFTMNYTNGGASYNPFAGATTSTTFTSTNFNAIQSVFNGASTINNINGSENTVSAGANTITAETVSIGENQNPQSFTGVICEAGFVAGTISSGNRSLLNTNMHNAYGGF